jgi:fatty acid desaturase
MYKFIHLLHHIGNMDKPDHNGNTIDTLSIYKYGSLGNPENVYSYIFKSYFRDDPFLIYKKMLLKNKREAYFSLLELFFMFSTYSFFVFINWKAILFILPFYYLGHSLSSLNGYYEHFGGNPNNPYLWAVSNYGKIYNITWMFNGYHAEHHYRPKVHWTKMVRLHNEIKEQQLLHGTKILSYPHAFGFLEK